MSEIDYLKCKLEDSEKAFDKLHKRYIELLKQQGALEQENANLVGDKIRSLEEFEKCTDKLKKTILNLREDNGQLRQILKDIVLATDETYTKNTSMFKVTVVLDNEKYREIRRCIE